MDFSSINITEPDAGSNSHKISTTAVRDGDDYVLRGTKYYISGVDEADALIVVARTSPEKLSLFLVPTDAPGLIAQRLPVGISVPEKQFTLFFDDVRLPASALIGIEHEGFRQVFDGLNPERITGAAVCVGVGRHAIEGIDRHPDLELVGVWVSDPAKVGKDAGRLAGLEDQVELHHLDLSSPDDVEAVVAKEDKAGSVPTMNH